MFVDQGVRPTGEVQWVLVAEGVTVIDRYDVRVVGLHRLFSAWSDWEAIDVIMVVAGMGGALHHVVGRLARPRYRGR